MKENRLRILMMVSWYRSKDGKIPGGSFHYEQVRSLNKYCDCAIYYPYDRRLEEPVYAGMEEGVLTYRSKYKLENKIQNRIHMFQAMKKIVKEFHPDLIHGNVATEAGRFAVMMGRLFHIPVMITEHSTVEASGVTSFPHHYYAKAVYKHSKYNACVSDDLTGKLEKIFPQYQFHTIYNGIRELSLPDFSEVYRKKDCINIGMVAAFYSREIKGVQFVLPAVQKMKQEGAKIILHIMGGGDYLKEYMDKARELGIDDICIFYDKCEKDKLFAIEGEMDFVLSASIFESFGCALAEGMMLGKPAVATKSGGVESIVNDQNGILIEKGSTEEIYRGLMEMCSRYRDYSPEEISKYIRGKFSADSISRKYMEIYDMIITEYKKHK